jgi:hypothetical protein
MYSAAPLQNLSMISNIMTFTSFTYTPKNTDMATGSAANVVSLNPVVDKNGGKSHIWKYFRLG